MFSFSMYPEITTDSQRHDYKREFDADLREYKWLCADMDDINDQLNKLSRQLDTMDDTSSKYQVWQFHRKDALFQCPEKISSSLCDSHHAGGGN